jgi:hypothetical protein
MRPPGSYPAWQARPVQSAGGELRLPVSGTPVFVE